MSRLSILLVSVLLISSSCKKTKEEATLPMEEDLVIDLLSDMHYASAAAKLDFFVNVDSLMNIYETQVLEIYGISKQEYDGLMNLLEENPTLYFELEKKVHENLKEIQGYGA